VLGRVVLGGLVGLFGVPLAAAGQHQRHHTTGPAPTLKAVRTSSSWSLAVAGWVVVSSSSAVSPVSTATGTNTTAEIHHHDSGRARHRRSGRS
jgi:hypothetical protein